ncbi:MAG TPA: efflux RND transporter permease subunit [Polyangia bacterium]|nr:efflux RND transporter permease subunit [Polyangia bacterium]
MTGLALRNPIAVLMACIGVTVFALVVTPRMSVDTFPELTPPVLVVGTQVPGLGPKDVEKTITWRLEKYVSATPGVDHVESVSRSGLSIVYVWLKWGTNLNAAQTLVQQQVAFALAAVPKSLGVVPPFVLQYDPSNAPVIQVAVSGGGLSGPQLFDYAFNHIEPVLEGIPGVASASPDGGRRRQINIVVDPIKASSRRLTSAEVAQAVSQANALLPSGQFLAEEFDANVYTNAVPPHVRSIGDAIIADRDGKPVLIRDVARVEDGGAPETQAVFVNGQPAVVLNVLRIPGGNTIEIVDRVKEVVSQLKELPPGVQVRPIFDQSTFVRTAYFGLRQEIVQALVLIAIVILLFLQSVRGTLIVAVAIPFSFAITLIVLYWQGQTLNAFTLGGLTLAMGRLVDDAVVVLESIHKHQKKGLGMVEAALEGTNAVALPVLASTLTTMAVLLPVVLLSGLAQKLFVPLALTVAVAMMASYFVSVCVTPVACRYFLHHLEPKGLWKRLEHGIDGLARVYAETLRHVLYFPGAVFGGALVLVAASGWVAAHLPSTFFPPIDESITTVYLRFAPGTSLAESARLTTRIGERLSRELPPETVELVLANIGSPDNARSAITSPNWGPYMGFVRLALADPEHRALAQQEIADRIRGLLDRDFPGVEAIQSPGGLVASVFANGFVAPVVVEIRGEQLEALDEEARTVAEVMRGVPGVRDIRSSLDIHYPEVRVEVNREQAGLVGVSARTIGQSTLDATLGNINTPSVWIDGSNGQSYYVVTYYDHQAVKDPNTLKTLPVRVSSAGRVVILGAYSAVRRSLGPVAVERNQLQRAVHVLAQTEGRDIGTVARDIEEALHADPRTAGVKFDFVGQVQLLRTTFSGLGLALALAVMVVYMIMATQFRSLRLPFIMLFTVPVALVGIVAALLAAGQGFSITALMGILMVIGIAVSNGILLVDAAANGVEEGAAPFDAVLAAARSRFVPILMTSLATVIGLIPTALGLEHGTEANRPLALAVVGGLTSSTVLSLFLVPTIFLRLAPRPSGSGQGTSL